MFLGEFCEDMEFEIENFFRALTKKFSKFSGEDLKMFMMDGFILKVKKNVDEIVDDEYDLD